jgi:transcriptional regulator with XRE-family HTH domain
MARLPKIHERIRNRRQQLGLRGRDLAERVGISPSYVSLIEKGAKVPDEAVALRIAAVLGDDEGLYRGWARAARLKPGELDQATRDLVNLRTMTLSPHARRMVERGTDVRDITMLDEGEPGTAPPLHPASRPKEAPAAGRGAAPPPPTLEARARDPLVQQAPASVPARLSDSLPWRDGDLSARREPEAPAPGPALVSVPLLPGGIDPDEVLAGHAVARDTLRLDGKLLPHAREDTLFAYEVTTGDSARLRGTAAAGDIVVLRRTWEIAPGRIHAVRLRKRVVLSRVLYKKNALLLLPPEGSTQFDTVEVWGEKGLREVLLGHDVLLIRR